MKILLHTGGSYGDISPFIEIGERLRILNHEVLFSVPDRYLEYVSQFKSFVYCSYDAPEELSSEEFMFRILNTLMHDSLKTLREHMKFCSDVDLIISQPLCPAAKIISDYLKIPKVDLLISPKFVMNSDRTDEFFNSYWLEVMNEIRYSLGLSSDKFTSLSPLKHSNLKLALFPRKIYSNADYENLIHTNVLHYEIDSGIPKDLQDFIDAGEPPVLVTLGSASWDDVKPYDFYKQVSDMAFSGLRVILCGSFDMVGNNLYVCAENIPHNLVFPQCRVVINHGGIGTVTKCLKFNTPQIIVPQTNEEQEISWLFSHFCPVLSPDQFTSENIIRLLDTEFYDCAIGNEYSLELQEDGAEKIIEILTNNKYIDGRDIKIS